MHVVVLVRPRYIGPQFQCLDLLEEKHSSHLQIPKYDGLSPLPAETVVAQFATMSVKKSANVGGPSAHLAWQGLDVCIQSIPPLLLPLTGHQDEEQWAYHHLEEAVVDQLVSM
jgi:hypothetical protein